MLMNAKAREIKCCWNPLYWKQSGGLGADPPADGGQ